MSDLAVLVRLLAKEKRVPQSYWDLAFDPEDPEAHSVLVFGCPDGNGPYLQVVFGAEKDIIRAQVIDGQGRTCGCKYCSPPKTNKKKGKTK